VPVPALVRYGVPGEYQFMQVSNSILCKEDVFGEHSSNAAVCEYQLSDTADFDEDGVVDAIDAFPSNALESIDTDGDGLGDNSDPFPNKDDNWSHCANKWHKCSVPAPALVRYGVPGEYQFMQVSDSIICKGSAFGQRSSSDAVCEYLLSDTADFDNDGVADSIDVFPSNVLENADTDGDGLGDNSDPFPNDIENAANDTWSHCANKWHKCSVPAPALVRYGVPGEYQFMQVSDSIICKGSAFGQRSSSDAVCEYLLDSDNDGLTDGVDPFPNDSQNGSDKNWIHCATQYDTCNAPVPALVRYGLDGHYYFLQAESMPVECINTVFGSPISGIKECDYLLSDTTDYDGDGVVDNLDAFPADPTETADTDGDGIGDNLDVSDNPHVDGSSKHGEHARVLDLVRHQDVTHTAINDGSWFNPTTWETGEVPGNNARVLIQSHIDVTYEGVSDVRLFTVRIEGTLRFSTTASSTMIVDTLFVDVTGSIEIGTLENPVQQGVKVDIVIADNGDIDVVWDPSLISRGVIAHGSTQIHGQVKTVHSKVQVDPMAGDTSIDLVQVPVGWQSGDTIVLAGTRYDGYKWNGSKVAHFLPEDEVLTIDSIVENVVHFSPALQFNHDSPRADLKTSVANYTRNVTFSSENGALSQRHHRGHVMFMHSDNADIRYATFHELGRTDKSIPALNAFEYGHDIVASSNVKGRYPMHFHRTGVNNIENPAIAKGNAVFSAPGWGYVHHDANVIMHNNASYKTFGAAFVAESGNEIGSWTNNIAIYSKGVSWGTPKNGGNSLSRFDLGRTGSGFYFQGRMVKAVNNIAASTNSGFAYFHRGRYADPETGLDGMIAFDASIFDLPEALGSDSASKVDDAPILHFIGNETFASKMGVFVEKANANQGHDVRTVFKGFLAWEVIIGAHIAYTSHYVLIDFDVVGKTPVPFSRPKQGIEIGKNASDITLVNSIISDFREGISVSPLLVTAGTSQQPTGFEKKQIVIVDPVMNDVDVEYPKINDAYQVIDSTEIVPDRFSVDLNLPQYNSDLRKVVIDGIKLDSLGEIAIPVAIDSYDAFSGEVVAILEDSGYFTSNGKYYFILEDYYSDRVTGEIHKLGEWIELDQVSVSRLGSQYFSFRDAIYSGEIDLNNMPPIVANDSASTMLETDIVIDLLANDTDPDGDTIVVDGIVQPTNGKVFDNGDGTITYQPDFDFIGTDEFKYWTTDNLGHYVPGTVTIDVQ
jgi:hypothetical protein